MKFLLKKGGHTNLSQNISIYVTTYVLFTFYDKPCEFLQLVYGITATCYKKQV
jgi:hypothetical protein